MPAWNLNDRDGLMNAAVTFYAILLIVACLLWLVTGVDLRPQLSVSVWTLSLGLLGVLPMLPVMFLGGRLRDLVGDLLGRQLSQCSVGDMAALAAMAGVGEELLFRGALQEWWARAGFLVGLIAANLIFGLLHAMTPMYFAIATAIGFYLSGLAEMGETRNLVAPMVAHGVYDFIGFLLIANDWRRRPLDDADPTTPDDSAEPAAEEPSPAEEPQDVVSRSL